jgi:hypothetical protein
MFDAPNGDYVVMRLYVRPLFLTSPCFSRIKEAAAVAATRGDLGQLAPRKKLLKSEKSSQKLSETLQALWQGGFFISPSLLP